MDFFGSLFLADFAWRPAVEYRFLGGFDTFLGGLAAKAIPFWCSHII